MSNERRIEYWNGLLLSARAVTVLNRRGIGSVTDLCQYTSDELLVLKNFGKRSLEIVEAALAEHGLHLRNRQPL